MDWVDPHLEIMLLFIEALGIMQVSVLVARMNKSEDNGSRCHRIFLQPNNSIGSPSNDSIGSPLISKDNFEEESSLCI